MRFFRTSLAPSTVNGASIHYILSMSKTPLQSIEISGDLRQLKIHCMPSITKNEIATLRHDIKAELMLHPLHISSDFKNNTLIATGFLDVFLCYRNAIKKLEQQEPLFFDDLDRYAEILESSESDESSLVNFFLTNSPNSLYRAQYFCFNALRQQGVQHAVELPLKALQKNGFLSQAHLNEIILQVWLKVNKIRMERETQYQPNKKLPEVEFIPYAFSTGK